MQQNNYYYTCTEGVRIIVYLEWKRLEPTYDIIKFRPPITKQCLLILEFEF